MKTRRREIARVGIFGSKDDPQIVTEKDLKEIEETFPEIKKAPVSLNGHWPDPAAPRLGNVVAVSYDEAAQTLTGEIEEEDALAEAVEAGYYADVSLGSRQRASDGKMYLHHLAYLGEQPPAIKDLVGEIKEGLGIAAGDGGSCRIFPSPSDRRLYLSDDPPENFLNKNMDDLPEPGPAPPQAEGAGGGGDSAHNHKEVVMTEEEAKKLREENEKLKAENEAKELALSDAAKEQKAAGRERLKAAMNGRIPLAQRDKVLALSDTLETGKVIELSDEAAPEGKRKTSPRELLVEVISALPLPVEPGVLNLGDGPAAGSAPQDAIKFSHI
ncbi:MAG: hypothetical protein LBD09_05605 [Treponema sp.]|jgi:hypothetical protein|nr:hypothetical protein [Treponema sp.]